MLDPTVARTRSAVGVAHRNGDPDLIIAARREHAAAKLADYIRRTVDASPPLSVEQRQKLALLLTGGSA